MLVIPIELQNLGFTTKHLEQLLKYYHPKAKDLQFMLEAFATDVQNGLVQAINPVGYFFGAMKAGGYNPKSANFKTSAELALVKELEFLKARQKHLLQLQENILTEAFNVWLLETPVSQLCVFVPPVGEVKSNLHIAMLKDYFLHSVYRK